MIFSWSLDLFFITYMYTSSIVDIFVYLKKMWYKVYFVEKAKITLLGSEIIFLCNLSMVI